MTYKRIADVTFNIKKVYKLVLTGIETSINHLLRIDRGGFNQFVPLVKTAPGFYRSTLCCRAADLYEPV